MHLDLMEIFGIAGIIVIVSIIAWGMQAALVKQRRQGEPIWSSGASTQSPPPEAQVSIATPAVSASGQPYVDPGPRLFTGRRYLYSGPLAGSDAAQSAREGEDQVVRLMEQLLTSDWTIFRDVQLPGYNGDIDVVLVGPGGVWALEVESNMGRYRVERGVWYKATPSGDWEQDSYSPAAHVREGADNLCKYLKGCGTIAHKHVTGVVVSPGESPVNVVSSGTLVWDLGTLAANLREMRGSVVIPPTSVERICMEMEQTYTRAAGDLLHL